MKSLIASLLFFLFLFASCSQDPLMDTSSDGQFIPPAEENIVHVTNHDGSPFTVFQNDTDISFRTYSPGAGGGVMMQAFYWDPPAGGVWWDTITSKLEDWSSAGIESLWLPPVSKAQSGAASMGYDPTDYFDLGEYNQNQTIETRFGSKAELVSLITEAHNQNMLVFADIVLNHNSGGQLETNQYTGTQTWTDFSQVASGKFLRSQHDFHPNWVQNNDEGAFGGFPDLSHANPYVQDWLWKRSDASSQVL